MGADQSLKYMHCFKCGDRTTFHRYDVITNLCKMTFVLCDECKPDANEIVNEVPGNAVVKISSGKIVNSAIGEYNDDGELVPPDNDDDDEDEEDDGDGEKEEEEFYG